MLMLRIAVVVILAAIGYKAYRTVTGHEDLPG